MFRAGLKQRVALSDLAARVIGVQVHEAEKVVLLVHHVNCPHVVVLRPQRGSGLDAVL